MRWIKNTLKYLLLFILLVAIGVAAFVNFAPTFGASPSGESLARIEKSKNYRDGKFENLLPTQIDTSSPERPRSISAYFSPPEDKNPHEPLPSYKFNAAELTDGKFVWLGHSTVLFNTGGQIVLADPVFHRASPIPFIGNPFPVSKPTSIADLPPIDVVIISHDHYDHLDHRAIAELKDKAQHFLVPLGLAAHLQHWGVRAEKISELDWYDSVTQAGINFTLTPARHFSGRGILNRFSTLWGSWVVKSADLNIWFSGDSGYFDELKKIGSQYGPFDIAFIENGAYSQDWDQIHMMPEQAVQASIDVRAATFFPIHWSKFDLALHAWDEPIIRAEAFAKTVDVNLLTPKIGEIFTPAYSSQQPWWHLHTGD